MRVRESNASKLCAQMRGEQASALARADDCGVVRFTRAGYF